MLNMRVAVKRLEQIGITLFRDYGISGSDRSLQQGVENTLLQEIFNIRYAMAQDMSHTGDALCYMAYHAIRSKIPRVQYFYAVFSNHIQRQIQKRQRLFIGLRYVPRDFVRGAVYEKVR